MHVVLLSSEYPPFVYGGVGSFVQNLANGLRSLGVEITIISGYPMSSKIAKCSYIEKNGVAIVRFPYPEVPPRHTLFQLLNLRRIYETVKNFHADVVHGQCGSTFPASLKLKTLAPIVVTFHDSPKANRLIGIHSLARDGGLGDFWTYVAGYPAWSLTFRKELCDSRSAVAVSRSLMSDLLDEMGQAHREKLCAIPNGVDLEELDSQYKSATSAQESQKTILFAGRLFWRKGAMNLIKVARLLQKNALGLELLVHGTGPLFEKMHKEIVHFGPTNIDLKGFTTRAELIESMKRSTFVILPSYYEACPMILVEGMCLGKIPVMFDLPYARELTQNGDYGIMARTVEDMITGIQSICERGHIGHLQRKIRQYARAKYDANKTALAYHHLYEQVCN
jgi:glycosyltransferase involved in cell wall biosynthesis